MSNTLKDKTAKGLFWGAVNNGSTQVLNLVIGIFLARLLTPADYGIVGVLTIFTAIAGALQSSGLGSAIINIKEPTDNDYNAVFWFNIMVSAFIYLILFICAPLLALFFNQPCLTKVSRVVFLCLPISAIALSSGTYLIKNMMNKEIAIIGIAALLSSGSIGVFLAYSGYAYWSLVVQQILFNLVTTLGRCYYSSWKPSLVIDLTPIKNMFAFCVRIVITNIANSLNQNLLTFIFGRLFSIHTVGNYSQANKWNTMAHSLVSSTVGQLTQTVFVSVSDEHDREIRVFRKMLRFTAFVSFPAMLGLALVGREFILVAIGEKWIDSVPLLQMLCIGGAFAPFYILYQHLIISSGRSDVYMWVSIGQIIVQLLLILGLYRYGITAVVVAYSVLNILWLLVWQCFANKIKGIRLFDVLKDVCPFLVISVVVMAATWLITSSTTNIYLLLVIRMIVAGVLYFILLRLAHAVILEECLQFIMKKVKKKE